MQQALDLNLGCLDNYPKFKKSECITDNDLSTLELEIIAWLQDYRFDRISKPDSIKNNIKNAIKKILKRDIPFTLTNKPLRFKLPLPCRFVSGTGYYSDTATYQIQITKTESRSNITGDFNITNKSYQRLQDILIANKIGAKEKQ